MDELETNLVVCSLLFLISLPCLFLMLLGIYIPAMLGFISLIGLVKLKKIGWYLSFVFLLSLVPIDLLVFGMGFAGNRDTVIFKFLIFAFVGAPIIVFILLCLKPVRRLFR